MNVAQRKYDEEFYRREMDGQKSRLERLKGRQSMRQRKYGTTRPKTGSSDAGKSKTKEATTTSE